MALSKKPFSKLRANTKAKQVVRDVFPFELFVALDLQHEHDIVIRLGSLTHVVLDPALGLLPAPAIWR